jgi:RHS repeat-associated protein
VNGANAIAFQYDEDSLLIQAGALSLTNDPQHGLLIASTLDEVTERWTYNGFGEPVTQIVTVQGSPLFSTELTRDAIGRIAAITEVVEGNTNVFTYSYDAVGNLTSVTRNAAVLASYAYDANRNRVSLVDAGGTLTDSHDNQDRLMQHGAAVFTHTTGGELRTRTVAEQVTTFDYDALGNLIAVTLPGGGRVDYLIDGRNRRIGRKKNGSLVQGFLYDGPRHCIAELDGSGNVVSRFVYGSREDVPEYMTKGGATYRIVCDHLGSVRIVVNAATGAVAQRIDYDTFGQVLTDTAPGFQPFGFAGGLYDNDTRLIRFGARDYDAETGRWTAKDPILFAGRQANLYAYANNDPINYRDPDGLQTLPDYDKQQQNKNQGNQPSKELKCPPKRDVLKEYQKMRKEFAGDKSADAAKKQKNALDKASDGINGGLTGY